MTAKSIKGKSPREIDEVLRHAMNDGFMPTLAIVFLSIRQDRDAICKILDRAVISIFGVTTAGEFIDGEVGAESTAILLMEINRASFTVLFEDVGARSTRSVANDIGQTSLRLFSNPAFIVCGSGVTADGEMIIRGIEDVGGDLPIFGAMAGDDFTMTGTFVFTNGKSSDNGIVAIILDQDKYMIDGLAACGWKS